MRAKFGVGDKVRTNGRAPKWALTHRVLTVVEVYTRISTRRRMYRLGTNQRAACPTRILASYQLDRAEVERPCDSERVQKNEKPGRGNRRVEKGSLMTGEVA